MSNVFFSFLQLDYHLVQQSSHGFLPVQHIPGLLIALNIILNFSLEIFVDPLILQNAQQTFVNFIIEHLILVSEVQMFLPQVFSL